MGLHGSDANVRTSNVLTKEAAALKPSETAKGPSAAGAGDERRAAGDAKEKDGDPVGAEKEYETAVKLDPSEENYFAWGAELLSHSAGPAAVQVFAKGAELHSHSARLRAGLGAAYYADGQYTEAAAQMCRASDLTPSDAQPYIFLGRMEKAAAEPLPCSEEHLKRFVEEQPGNALAHYYYGLVLWKKARKAQEAAGVSEAEEQLRRAAKLDPSLGEAYLQLGLLSNARGRREEALAQFKQAAAASPDLSAGHYQLSLAYRRSGDTAAADAEMKKYEELRRSEDVQLEKDRREMRQFVTVMKDASPQKH
jgi:tetratricopeptide (TPR) repeat protein